MLKRTRDRGTDITIEPQYGSLGLGYMNHSERDSLRSLIGGN